MTAPERFFDYLPDGISFTSQKAAKLRTVYAPLCGIDGTGLKSSITPYLSGDIKIDKYRYLTKPAAREDLREDVRNFFLNLVSGEVLSLTQETSPDSAVVEVGQLWQKLTRTHATAGIEMTALNFIPVTGENVELMRVTIKNISDRSVTLTPTAVIPIFGRSLANKHDHEHVTALLNRIKPMPEGVCVEPTMAFNEEGHKVTSAVYFVFGMAATGDLPAGTFPTADDFYGESGQRSFPEAIVGNRKPAPLSDVQLQGKEAVGALQFKSETLKPEETREFVIAIGLATGESEARATFHKFDTVAKFDEALAKAKKFWHEKSHSLRFKTGNSDFNSWMQWVTLQPVLRRIFGCSFLPDHDYGKGGKGWRDIWQDLLSLILIEPEHVREALINNFAGVRVDGTNATIIGARPGEFIADRNVITRVWMDHGVWPFLTAVLYIEQTGDFDLLFEQTTYFRDPQQSRTYQKDNLWTPAYGNKLKDTNGEVYKGTILEHILVQNLVQFFNVGEHNIIRLENADWNDGLDMAFSRGESVAFMAEYAGNLLSIADLLETLKKKKNISGVRLAKELLILLDSISSKPCDNPTAKPCDYNSIEAKKEVLFGKYFKTAQPELSGDKVEVTIEDLAKDLRRKGQWIFEHIRRQEKISVEESGKTFTWFNGYYDNQGKRVEGDTSGRVRMTLTGQVFALMSGLAGSEDAQAITASVDHFLKDKTLGGYRLNTDFGVRHYLELGRAFGFAYGTKENGAFFSHMNVMYAYALYKQGLVRQGFEVLNSIYAMANDPARARIYPGVPEYFDGEGRGMYHYLTGSASWYVLTALTQAFGVRGSGGDLVLAPKLVREQFGIEGRAQVSCSFAGRELTVIYDNPKKLDCGHYTIKELSLNGQKTPFEARSSTEAVIKRSALTAARNEVTVVLG
jgi:cellobiose phosphorylase